MSDGTGAKELSDTWVEPAARSDIRAIRRDATPTERVGTVVAERYTLQSILGTGASGVVYAALDAERGERVALSSCTRTSAPRMDTWRASAARSEPSPASPTPRWCGCSTRARTATARSSS